VRSERKKARETTLWTRRSEKLPKERRRRRSRDSPAAHEGDHAGAGISRGEPHAGAGGDVQKAAEACGKPTLGQSYPKALQTVGKNHAGEGKEHEVGEAKWCELITAPIPFPLHYSAGESEVSGGKMSLGRREGRGQRSFWFYFNFSLSCTVINWQ